MHAAKQEIGLDRRTLRRVGHIVAPDFRETLGFEETGHIVKQCLIRVERFKRGFDIDIGKAGQERERSPKNFKLEPLYINLQQRRGTTSSAETKASSGPASTSVVPTSWVPGNSSDCRSEIGSSEELSAEALTCIVAVPRAGDIAASCSTALESP